MVLQALRERLTGIIAIFIFGILIIPFVFVGVDSYFTSNTQTRLARVNGEDITQAEFTESFQNYRRRMQSLLGANFDAEQFDQPTIRRQHLDNLIDQRLLSQVSSETGLAVDDARLAEAIRAMDAFHVDGEFNADVYQSRLRGESLTPQQFENQIRAQLILDQYPGTIAASAIATGWELRNYARLQDEKRAFSAIVVPAEQVAMANDDAADDAAADEEAADAEGAAAVDESTAAGQPAAEAVEGGVSSGIPEEEIRAWYESHADDFRAEERVEIEYLEQEASQLGGDISADEEQLRARFEQQQARFITPEQRLASHILLEVDAQADEANIETVRQQAAELAERARGGEDFEALAREHSKDAGSASQGGDLGWIEPGFMVQAFEDALYALTEANPISDPVQTGFGWHVIWLREIRPAEGMSFAEARDTLEQEFLAEERERLFLDEADRLVDLIYEDPTTLTSAAEVLGLEIRTAGPFSRSGGEDLAGNPAVVNAAFSDLALQQGVVSDPVDLGENHMVMLRVRQHFPEAVEDLSVVRGEVIAAIESQRALEAAERRATRLKAAIEAGGDMPELAASEGLELKQSAGAGRSEAGLERDLLQQVFRVERPQGPEAVVLEVVPLDAGYAVVRLESVTEGALGDEDRVREENYRRRISNATANIEAVGFLRLLRSQSEIEVFEDRL